MSLASAPVVELTKVSKAYGGVPAVCDVSFAVTQGEVLAILGASGCGKTTTLRLIAGFAEPDEGRIVIRGRDMRGVRPYERNIGIVFQDYALFPHLSVRQNIAYGLKQRGAPRDRIAARVDEMLSLVRLPEAGDRMPLSLSGGQQQRVALARALATQPDLVLLDEPLSALDAKLRQDLGAELKSILAATDSTAIIVTHDQAEAMTLADQILVMARGQVLQRGTAAAIYSRPATREVASFIGRSNWIEGRLGRVLAGNLREFDTDEGSFVVPDVGAEGECAVCFRPERLEVLTADRDGVNSFAGRVVSVTYLGPESWAVIELPSGRRFSMVIANRAGQQIPALHSSISVAIPITDCIVARNEL